MTGEGGIRRIVMTLDDGTTITNSEDDGITLVIENPDDEEQHVHFSFADLADARRTRIAWYEQTGWVMPHYADEDHAKIVTVLLQLSGYRQVDR